MAIRFDYSGKKVLVVGGTSGINLGIAEGFARSGAQVAVISRSQEKVDAAVATLSQHGQQAFGASCDVRDGEALQVAIDDLVGKMSGLDVVVSGAAGNFPVSAEKLSLNGFKTVVDIDLMGTFHVMKAVFPHLKKSRGNIINISAPQSFVPMELQAHVCAAKAGIDQITRVLAMEWGPLGIRVNSLIPGPIEGTEGMARLAPTPEILEATRMSVPSERLGNFDDMANAALFVAAEESSYINGVLLPVDGGWALSGAGVVAKTMSIMAKKMGHS